tara:strand:- start:11144 stop:14140 length:2997 start_codon:yes stop_codon:yes gene_type:complete
MATDKDFRVKDGLVVEGDITAVNLDISGNVDVDGTLEADAITLNGTSLATSATTDTTNASNIGSGTLATGRLAAALTAQTSMLNTSLVVGRDADNQIKFSTDNQMIFRVGAGDGVTFKASGEIEATSLDISGDVDVDGTLEADAITVNGSALASSATTDTTNASNISSGTLASGRLPDLAVSDFAASAIVLESEGIGSNDNDTTLPTSAAVKDYVDNNAGGSPAGSDTFIQYNNGGSFGATTLAFDDTAGSEQILLDDTSDVALMKVVQRGTGSSFEVHDQASDSTVFQVSASGATSIGLGAGSGTGSDILFVQGRSSGQIWTASTSGSASAPVFTRRTDLNTGMYFIGADNIGLTTGGTLRVDISDSGLKLGSSGSRVTTILNEDDMSTDSDTALATQQSIKAYVDNNAGGASLANDANNRVVTATGSGGINGEANLTFDGSTLALAGKQTITVNDDVSEAFKVTITDTDSTADSTPFVVDGDGRVGIGTASPVSGCALTLNGDGTSYEGIAFQVAGSTKFKMTSDGSSFYHDSHINTGKTTFRVRDSGGNLRPTLGISGSNYSVAIGYNGTSGSSLTPNNTLQVNVGTENGVQDKDDGILLLNSDLSIAANDMIGGVGFATRDGNIPSSVTEAACAIVARAREDHTTTEKGGYLEFLYSPAGKDDDTVSSIGMTLIEGKLAVNNGGLHPLTTMTLYHSGSDFNDGLTIIRNDTSVSDGDLLGAIGFDAKDGNAPSRATEASAGIAAFAAENHSTGDKGGDLTFFTSPIDQDDDTASVERMRITSEGQVIIGDTPNFTSQHDGLQKFNIQGTDAGMLIEKHDDSASGGPTIALYRYSASEADGDLIGQVSFRGEGSTGNPSTYMMMRAEILDVTEGSKDGQIIFRGLQGNSQTDFMTVGANGVRNMIGSVVAVSSNTTLTDDESGSYVYWTGGTLTLPATAIKGQQFVVINNTNGSATPSLGTSNAIATNWTTHAAMADETSRTYIAVAANTWIYIG